MVTPNPLITSSNWWKSLSPERRAAFEEAVNPTAESTRGKSVEQIDTSGRVIAVYASCSEAARKTGINQGNISSVCHGRLQHTGGYIWRIASEPSH